MDGPGRIGDGALVPVSTRRARARKNPRETRRPPRLRGELPASAFGDFE